MLVDDEKDLLESTQFLLESRGFQVSIAKDGLEAISVYQQQKPSMVFMDVRMPKMDGFEAFEKIITIDKNAKIVLVSGFQGDVKKITDAKNKGLCCYHNKPVRIEKLEELIEKFT